MHVIRLIKKAIKHLTDMLMTEISLSAQFWNQYTVCEYAMYTMAELSTGAKSMHYGGELLAVKHPQQIEAPNHTYCIYLFYRLAVWGGEAQEGWHPSDGSVWFSPTLWFVASWCFCRQDMHLWIIFTVFKRSGMNLPSNKIMPRSSFTIW